jgi:hypothetical protein
MVEGDVPQAIARYQAVLDHIKDFTGTLMGVKPSEHYEAPKTVKAAADKLAIEPATMGNAYTIYEALEAFYPYELQKAEALIGMGDILVAQGKPLNARTKYEKAVQLRKNYAEGKLAQEKLNALAAQKPATAQ